MQIKSKLSADGRSIVERLLEAYGSRTLQELADRMVEHLSTVKGWKQRGSVPIDHAVRASVDTGCSLDWLVLGYGQFEKQTLKQGVNQTLPVSFSHHTAEGESVYGDVLRFRRRGADVQFVLVPRFCLHASAGPGHDNGDQELPVGEIAFEATWMRTQFGRTGTGFALLDVVGNSMEPTLWDGETILVDLQSREVISGAVYVLRDDDELLVKRLQRLIGGSIEVLSDNQAFRSQVVPDLEQLTVIGRVVWPRVR